MKYTLSLLCLLLCLSLHAQTIEVSAGQHARYSTPVFVTLSKPLPPNQSWQVVNQKTHKSTPAQLTDSLTLAFILPDSLAPNTKATYTLQKAFNNHKPPVVITQHAKGLQVTINNKPLFVYHTKEASPPADSPAYYKRSGFIYPLYSPNGQILTDDFPAGHAHQHAIFTAWAGTTFRNDSIDFWNQHKQKGTVEHVQVLNTTSGPIMTQLQVLLRYKSFAHDQVLQEKWTIRIYPFSHYYLFDLFSEQVNTTKDTLFLEKYNYGGLAFRGSAAWNPDDKVNFKNNWHILTSEGIRDSAANHTHARWVDAHGIINGKTAGATIFNYPSNFRYPQAIRVHPAFPYWCYAPVVDGPFSLNPGTLYRSQFRYYVHEGAPNINTIERLEKDWIAPPVTSVR
jgi:hypothetical protein